MVECQLTPETNTKVKGTSTPYPYSYELDGAAGCLKRITETGSFRNDLQYMPWVTFDLFSCINIDVSLHINNFVKNEKKYVSAKLDALLPRALTLKVVFKTTFL